jgi:hypothetical protein
MIGHILARELYLTTGVTQRAVYDGEPTAFEGTFGRRVGVNVLI